jgi:hypothetical protein
MAKLVAANSVVGWLIDPFRPTGAQARRPYQPGQAVDSWIVPTGLGVALLVMSLAGWAVDPRQFYFSYLVGWVSCLSIAVGALFFVIINHLTRSRWSVVVRRIAEVLIWSFPALAVLSIPIFVGAHDLFHWTHQELFDPSSPHFDPILAGKSGYLNMPFFTVRIVAYFLIWSVISYLLYANSIRQDVKADPDTPARLRKISAVALPLTAVTTAFASYDVLMSLDPHWFSTIFGVYFFAASFWTAHATIALTAVMIQRRKGLRDVITREHYHDLGKMMFGFTVFWAYIAFSQYMLIWYGNLPEETVWYRHRLSHGWEVHSAILLIAHFVIPFWVLLPRRAKRAKSVMTVMALWFLAVNWFDFHWIAMPVLHPEQAGFHWLDVTCWLGLFGLFVGMVLYRLRRHGLVPQNDPYLEESLRFVNA